MILRLHFAQVRPGWYTVEAWSVSALAGAVMVGANAVADRNDPLGGGMHAVVRVVAMLVWHVVIHGRPADTGQDTNRTSVPGVRPLNISEVRPNGRPAREVAKRLVQRHGQDATADMVMDKTGVSRRHASRLLAEVCQRDQDREDVGSSSHRKHPASVPDWP